MRFVAQACAASGGILPPFSPPPAVGIMGSHSPSSSTASTPRTKALLGEYPRLPQWVAAFTLKVPSRAVRRAVAKALFQICEEEVSTAPSLRTARKAPEVLPLLLRLLLPRLQQAGEVFVSASASAGPETPSAATATADDELDTTRYDGRAACGQSIGASTSGSGAGSLLPVGGSAGGAGAAAPAASISSSHEFLALLAALLQLALQPGR